MLALVLTATTLLVWFVEPVRGAAPDPGAAPVADRGHRRRAAARTRARAAAAGGLLPFAVVVLYYLSRLSLGPLRGIWYLFLVRLQR